MAQIQQRCWNQRFCSILFWKHHFFLAHIGPLITNWASFKQHSHPEYRC